MAVVTISTCLPMEIHARIKKNGYKMPELIRLGLLAKEGNPQLVDRIRGLEQLNESLAKKLQIYAARLYKYEIQEGENNGKDKI